MFISILCLVKIEASIDLFMISYISQTQADHSQLDDQEMSRSYVRAHVHIRKEETVAFDDLIN